MLAPYTKLFLLQSWFFSICVVCINCRVHASWHNFQVEKLVLEDGYTLVDIRDSIQYDRSHFKNSEVCHSCWYWLVPNTSLQQCLFPFSQRFISPQYKDSRHILMLMDVRDSMFTVFKKQFENFHPPASRALCIFWMKCRCQLDGCTIASSWDTRQYWVLQCTLYNPTMKPVWNLWCFAFYIFMRA